MSTSQQLSLTNKTGDEVVLNVETMQRVNPHLYELAKNSMSKEELEYYEKIGKEMYESIDYENSTVLNQPDEPLIESVAYIKEAVKSGLHPSYLTEDERKVMEEWKGPEWYTYFGYDSIE